MNFKNALITAVRSLRRNKMRSLLTSVGIIIGVSSVILMIGLGSSARIEVKDKVTNFGENGISLDVKPRGKLFTHNDVMNIRRDISEISYITPVCYRSRKMNLLRYRSNLTRAVLWGVNNDFLKIKNRHVVSGRAFTQEDIKSYGKVTLIGETVRVTLFGRKDPIGEHIQVNGVPLKVIGILNRAGKAFSGRDFDDIIIVPYTTTNVRFFGRRFIYSQILMATADEKVLDSAEKKLISYFRQGHNLRSDAENDFFINTSKQKLKMTEDIMTALSLLLAGIASISLFVGGVGIMNIMLVSVTERTREIGIRMAIGAKKKDVLVQFLIESVTLTSVGGAVGISLGLIMYLIIVIALKWTFVFSLMSVLLSFFFSTAVGVFFGYYPAKKASNLRPIEALKFE